MKNILWAKWAAAPLLLCSLHAAHAESAPITPAPEDQVTTSVSQPSEATRRVGQSSLVELDGQAGLFSGLRLKVLPFSLTKVNFAVEGMVGGSIYSNSIDFPATYGGGVRAEFYFTSKNRHAWMFAPGIDGYYVSASPYTPPPAQSLGEVFGNAIDQAFKDAPTRVVMLSPNVDFNWLFQVRPHFGMVLGAKAGFAVSLNGYNTVGTNLAGKLYPDGGIYAGVRF